MNNMQFDEGERYIQSVFRALKIMEFAGEQGRTVGLTEISRGLGLSKSTTHGIVATLERCGYLQQDVETGKYSLGLKLFELGQAYVSNLDLRAMALPYLKELSSHYQETAHLAVLSRGDVIYIDKVDGPLSIGINSQVGGRNPSYCTGVGKILLSGLTDEQVAKLYEGKDFVRYTEKTVASVEQLLQDVHSIRKQGYAFDKEEFEIGLQCAAVPIRDAAGNIVAAISLSGPAHRLTDSKLEQVVSRMLQMAQQISGRLGYRGGGI